MRNIDVHAFCARPLHLCVNCTCHNIAGRQSTELMIPRHEFAPGRIDEFATLSPHRLANQERFFLRIKKAGGMELNKLHVRDCCSDSPSHRDSVSGRHIGIRCIEVNLAASASGEDHTIAPPRFNIPGGIIESIDTDHAILGCIAELPCGDQINTHVIIENPDVAFLEHRIEQTLLNFASGRIVKMKDASLGVSSFSTQVQFALAILQGSFVELDSNTASIPLLQRDPP